MQHARLLALVAAVIAFSWPALSGHLSLAPPSYLGLTAVLAAAIAGCVRWWPAQSEPLDERGHTPLMGVGVTAIGGLVVALAGLAWIRSALALPYAADMLIVIREATGRFLEGANPYATYRTHDAPWGVVLPYGPMLWGPYLLPRALHIDLRIVTIIGELAVPVVTASAAAAEAVRGRVTASVLWLTVLIVLVGSVQLTAFTGMGHTPVYWPLLPVFAWLVTSERWRLAALALGVLVVARSTMVALVPVLLIAVWHRDRAQLSRAVLLLAIPGLLLLAPFAIWDPAALWGNMVASYPRLVKESVWPAWSAGAIDTMGVTAWLVAWHLEQWAVAVQVAALLATYAAAWRALGARAAPLPWMALALTAFSMTVLWPVFYLFFDVLLLLICGAAVEVLGRRVSPLRWAGVMGATALAVLLTGVALTEAHPTVVFVPGSSRASYALPRRTRDAAIIEVDYHLPAQAAAATTVTATLNGHTLWSAAIGPGRGTLRIPAPAAAWWRGYNRLDLLVVPTPPPAATVDRITVAPLRR